MQEGYWVTRTYQAGAVGEKTKFFIPGTRPTGKLGRRAKDAVRKQEQNEYSSQKALARLLNENTKPGDLLMGLDYSDKGIEKITAWARKKGLPVDSEDEQERENAMFLAADHELDNCLRRVKNRLKKKGIELKAIYCTSDRDGETGLIPVRVHHHLVVQADVQGAFLEAWEECGMGSVDWTPLWENQADRTPIAEYWIRQVRRLPNAKKYRHTQNVVVPKPKDRVALSDAELRVPKGCKLIFRQEYRRGAPQYIRYELPAKDKPGETGRCRNGKM